MPNAGNRPGQTHPPGLDLKSGYQVRLKMSCLAHLFVVLVCFFLFFFAAAETMSILPVRGNIPRQTRWTQGFWTPLDFVIFFLMYIFLLFVRV